MNETVLAIARKVILCVGLLVAVLLFVYPHWRMAVEMGDGLPVFEQDAGRAFILSPPLAAGQAISGPSIGDIRPILHINRFRQIVEVSIALLFTFALVFVLRKPAPPDPDQVQLIEELTDELNKRRP
jgi:hypothetical protein